MRIAVRAEDDGGRARPVLYVDDRRIRSFVPHDALNYAEAFVRYAARGEMVLAIKRQMTDDESGIGLLATADLVGEFLAELPPATHVWPLTLTLAADTQWLGRVNIRYGASSGLWTPQECRNHALDLMRASADIDLTETYRRVLTGYMRLTPERADLIVQDLRGYLPSPRH